MIRLPWAALSILLALAISVYVGPPGYVGPPELEAAVHVGPPGVEAARYVGPPGVEAAGYVGPPGVEAAGYVGPPELEAAMHVGPPGVEAASQQAVFRATATVVAVDATVTQGRTPVAGLGPQDFLLLDNGVRQEIESVTHGTMPLDVTVVLDFSGSAEDDFPRFMTAATGMQRLLRKEDLWRWLGIFMEARELLPMRPALDPLPSITRPGQVRVTALHDSLFLALVRPGEPERRHLVIVFTDGNDTWSMLDARQLPAISDKADAVLHAVVSASPPSAGQVTSVSAERLNQRWRESQNALFDAARQSGGAVHRLSNRAEAFAKIIEDFRSAYVLRYTPKGVNTPGWHEVRVSVIRPGSHTIRARKGYEAP